MTAHDDAARLRALIADMRGIEREHALAERPYEWTEDRVAAIFSNPESDRLVAPPMASPEVERLAKLAVEVSPKA